MSGTPSPGRREIAIVLMQGSPEAQAAIDVLEQDRPDLEVSDHGTYWKVTSRSGKTIEIDLDRVAEELGSPLTMAQFLVVLTTYVGRVEASSPRKFVVTSDMAQMTPHA